MRGGFIDRRRAERLMTQQGLDALLLTQPETVRYASGGDPGVASSWRRAGAAFVLVPSDAAAPLAAVVGDLQAASFRLASGIPDVRTHPLWVETAHAEARQGEAIAASIVAHDRAIGRMLHQPRPATYDLSRSLRAVADILGERGLLRGRIGLELGFVPANEAPLFKTVLPGVAWLDATELVGRIRAVKHPVEAKRLRIAAELAMAGVQSLVEALRPGLDAAAMTRIWREGTRAEASRRRVPNPQSDWAYIAVGGDGFAPGQVSAQGDVIKIDVGCVVDGYSSDGARTAILGPPNAAQRTVYDALHRAFDAGLAQLRPGIPLKEAYAATAGAMWDAGFATYGRGHFGHSLGGGIWSEDWPFISADATVEAEAGMVLAFETPYYLDGLGGFIIEDQMLLTPDGVEVMAPMSRDLIQIAV